MRRVFPLLPAVIALLGACATQGPATAPSRPAVAYGLTVEEEAKVIAMEDRRAIDPKLVAQWVSHPNALHRRRIAIALGRIGPHAFVDGNGNGTRDEGEKRAGATELEKLSTDPDHEVRLAATFALGELADKGEAETLFYLAADSDPAVAAEAAEAISKVTANAPAFRVTALTRYLWLLDARNPEAVRARAARYLFRFDTNEASAAALRALSEPSAIRQEAAYSLARRAYPPARRQLELLLTDEDVLTRAYAAAALGRIADPASATALLAALGDVHPWVRTNAAVAMSKVADKTPSVLNRKDLPRIFAAVDDPDPGVKAVMIDLLGAYAPRDEEARPRLLAIFSNGSQWERELAAGSIAKHFPADRPPWKLLVKLTPWQVVRVVEATASLPNGTAIRRQYAAHAEPMVRASVLSAIPDDRVDNEIAVVMKGLNDPDVIVRASAYERFGVATKVPAASWLRSLRDALKREETEPMNDGRVAAIQALAKYDSPRRQQRLEKLLGDRDPVVRRVAADLIEETFHVEKQYTPLNVRTAAAEYKQIARWARQPHTATIHMTRGNIEIALLPQDAPIAAWNFAQLAQKKYFDNTSFMRVVPNFVIQGGDPRNDMNGGPGYAIRDEINMQRYTRGAVGMALSGPDTGGSQFFITHSPQPHLDGGYTIFGRVYEGMSGVVDQVERGDRVETITIDERPPAGTAEIERETGLAPQRAGVALQGQ